MLKTVFKEDPEKSRPKYVKIEDDNEWTTHKEFSMKIYVTNVREDEVQFINAWQEAHGEHEVAYTTDMLTLETIQKLDGFDAVNILQLNQISTDVFGALANKGIHIMNLRNVGIDNLDLAAAKEFGFQVSNVPSYSPNAIAEHAVMLMMRALRRTPESDARIAAHDFRWAPTIARELRMQTVGVIGTGRIGRVVIDILQGFGAKVIVYDLHRSNAALEAQGLYVDTLDELYAQADIITLHMPETAANHHIINAATLAKMRPRTILVNVSRGGLVDVDAVLTALADGNLAFYALDTYEGEFGIFNADWRDKKLPDARLEQLLARPDVLVTPHIAFYTETAVSEMVNQSLDAGVAFYNGELPSQNVEL